MPYRNSAWTGRIPRTLNQAFGEDAHLDVEPEVGAAFPAILFSIAAMLLAVGVWLMGGT